MYTKNSFKMLVIILSLIGFSSIEAYSAAVSWDGGAATSNWFDPLNWSDDDVPGDDDDVTIADGSTVNINGNADVNSLTVTNGIVRPDASSGRTIIIARDLSLGANGSILYTDLGGTGRLSWTFEGQDGSNTIDNQSDGNEADLQLYNVTIDGTIVTGGGANRGDMSIYGDLTVNGSFQPDNTVGRSTVHFVGIASEGGKTISNNGTLELSAVELSGDASITTITDISVIGNLDIPSGSSLVMNSPSIFTTDDTEATAVTYTNNGTLTFAAGTTWNINKNLTVAEDITGIAGDVALEAAAILTVTSTKEIAGTGNFSAGNGAGIIVSDADGVAGAIALTGTKTWPTGANAINVTILTGSTGFSGASLTTIHDLTLGTETGAAIALTTNDTFTMTGSIAITENTGGVTSFTASSGTITMSGAGETINANDETLSFFGLSLTGTISGDRSLSTLGAGEGTEGFTITNSFAIPTAGGFDIDNSAGDETYNINLTGTNTLEVVDAGALEFLATGAGDLVILNIQGTTTLLDDLTIAQAGDLADDFYLIDLEATGTLDLDGFFMSLTAAAQDNSDFTSAAGSTVICGLAGGLNASVVLGDANIQVAYDPATNFTFTDNATDFGFDAANQAGGTAAELTTVNGDITIDGAAITAIFGGGAFDLTLGGNFTVTTGSFVLASGANPIVDFGTAAGSVITNSTGNEDNLVFNILDISGANTVAVDGDISIARAGAAGLTNSAGAGTLDCTTNDATVHFVGATLDISSANGATYNFHNVEIENITTVNANVTAGLMNIEGNLTITAPGTLTGAALSQVSFTANGEQTIETNGQTCSFDLFNIAANSDVLTNDNVTIGNNDGAITIPGQIVTADPSVVTVPGTANINVSGNSATFFALSFGGIPAAHAGNYSVINTVTGAGTYDPAGNITFLGNPTAVDATGSGATDEITNDGFLEATIDVTTLGAGNNGTIIVSNNCELQVSVAIADATNFNVDGRLELTQAAAICAAASTIDLTTGNGGTLHLSDLDGANAVDLGAAVTANGGTLTSDATSIIIINGTQTTMDAGNTGIAFTVNNLILNSGAAMTLEAGDIFTINGTLTLSGTDNVAGGGDPDSEIILAGANSSITGDQTLSVGSITVQAAATGATINADLIILEEDATAVVEVAAGGGLTASAGEIQINAAADAGVANIINGNADGSGLIFNDLSITATGTETDFDSGVTVNGTLDVAASGKLHALTTAGVLTLNGTNENFNFDLNAAGDIELFNVVIDGSITVDNDGAEDNELIEIFGNLTVTGNGSLAMTDGGVSFGDGGGLDGTDAVTVTNNGTLQFHDLVINKNANTDDVSITANYTVNGNLTNTQGEFRNTGNEVSFEGTGTLTSEGGNASSTFNNVSFDGTTTLGAGALDIDIYGNLVVSTGNSAQRSVAADAISFFGSTSKEIVNGGTLVLGAVTVADEDNNEVTTDDSFIISGDLVVGAGANDDESFTATDGVITFNGGAAQALTNATGNSTDLQLSGVTITGASTDLNTTGDFYVNGDIVIENDAIFDMQANDSRVFMNGSTQQSITLTGTGTAATSGRFFAHNATLLNSNGYVLNNVSNAIADDQFTIQGTFRIQSGDLDLNGNNVITVDVTNGGTLVELEGNTVVNNGPTNSTGNILATQTNPTLSNNNFGGLGVILTLDNPTTIDGGSALTIRRYHIAREIGGNTQASRYFSIVEDDADELNARYSFKYDPSEVASLTENDLILLYADDADGPWVKQAADLNTTLKRQTVGISAGSEKIDNFAGETEFWTIGTPSELAATQLTSGLAGDTLAAGTSDNAIFGVQFTADGNDITMTSTSFNLGRNINAATAEFTEYALYYSADNNYGTTSDNVALINGSATIATITGGGTSDNYVGFNLSAVDASYVTVAAGTPVNYFLVVSTQEDLNLNTATFTPSINQGNITITDGISNPFDLTGTTYRFRSSIEVSPNENGLTETPLVAGVDGYAIFGFKTEITNVASLPGFTGFTLDFEGDPSAVFENIKVFESENDSDFDTDGDNNEIVLTSSQITDSSMVFVFAEQNLALTPQYYFVTADVKNTVDPSAEAVTPTMVYSKITSTNAGVRGTNIEGETSLSHTGYTYDFVESMVTLSTDNNPAAGNIGRNLGGQPLYGFTLTPDNNQPVTLESVNLQVTFSDETESENVDSWKLFVDQNGNGYGDSQDSDNFQGTYNNGSLSFSNINQTFNSETKFIVTATVKSATTVGTTIGVQILGNDYLTIDQPNMINAGGPFPSTANLHTVRNSGVATAVELVGTYETTVITGNTLSFIVRAVDASGYPTRVTSNAVITVDNGAGTGTVGGTNTGTIFSGTGFQVIEPTITNGAISTDLQVDADDAGSLTTSALSNAITILLAAPTSNGGEVFLDDITATTVGINGINAPAANGGDGRIVVMKQGGRPDAPTNGINYTVATDISNAGNVGVGQTGPGSYVVYNTGTGVPGNLVNLSVDVEGLLPSKRYYFMVFDYNGTGNNLTYATATNFTSDASQNPKFVTTLAGTLSNADSTSAVNIQTDVDVASAITTADASNWFKFRVSGNKLNSRLVVSNLPANYHVDIYEGSGNVSEIELLRQTQVAGTSNEVLVINELDPAKTYYIKVYGDDSDQFSTSSYNLRVSTSAREFYSLTQE